MIRATEKAVALSLALGLGLGFVASACSSDAQLDTGAAQTTTQLETDGSPLPLTVELYQATVINTYPHDPQAYTQGLEFVDGQLLESTGRVGESSIRIVEPVTGAVTQSVPIADVFAEGATVVGDEIWQLTWTEQTLIVHSLDGLTELRRQSYAGEGWGLCATSERLIMSNGSSELTFRDRETFEVIDSVTVTFNGQPVAQLNELECVGERVWANIFQSNTVVEIDPVSGRVVGSVDLSALVPDQYVGDGDNVLNGIAYNEETGRFWLTGKRWPVMYEVDLIPTS